MAATEGSEKLGDIVSPARKTSQNDNCDAIAMGNTSGSIASAEVPEVSDVATESQVQQTLDPCKVTMSASKESECQNSGDSRGESEENKIDTQTQSPSIGLPNFVPSEDGSDASKVERVSQSKIGLARVSTEPNISGGRDSQLIEVVPFQTDIFAQPLDRKSSNKQPVMDSGGLARKYRLCWCCCPCSR